MTLRDMITRIESTKCAAKTEPYSHEQLAEIDKSWDQIIAALRAGQEMRDAQISGIQGEMFLAVKAWDAACGKDK